MYSGLIFFEIYWFDLLAVQGTLKSSSASQFQSVNSLLLCLLYDPALTAMHDYWKDHNLDYMEFVGKVISLLFSIQSKFVIAFLPRSNHLLISWLHLR